jgi:hypothetical protein
MTFVKIITLDDGHMGRSCHGHATPADTAASCSCGWAHHGPGADTALCGHLYGDLRPAVREAAIAGLP